MQIPDLDKQPTLGKYAAYYQADGKALDEWLQVIMAARPGHARELDLSMFHVERAYSMYAFFNDLQLDQVKATVPVTTVLMEYADRYAFLHAYQDGEPASWAPIEWQGRTWVLPDPELDNRTRITFGEFIDAKTFVQTTQEENMGKWEMILYIAAIFLRPEGEAHQEHNTAVDSERLQLMVQLPMSAAHAVALFFERFNGFLEKHFTIFHPAVVAKPGKYTAKHFEIYGWINFLKAIAKTKIYDILGSNKNSIECAREASLFDVLVDASEEKSLAEAQAADAEIERERTRH